MTAEDALFEFSSTDEKSRISDLAYLGGSPMFVRPRSTSNLLKPDIEKFLEYSRIFYEAGQFTNNGPVAQELESRLAKFHDTEHCLVFSSGFWAIALAMRCLALEGRDEVIMPSLTYRRMADIVAWLPLTIRYCEVDPVTLAMTAETVENRLSDRTALILGTHPIVNCCDAEKLEQLGRDRGIPVLFDSVESVYETVPGGRVGGFGAAECFSLHACKLLNGFGGGYLTSNDDILVRKLASMRTFGFTAQDRVGIAGGLNAKLNEMHAAMALASLDDIEEQVRDNKSRYKAYQRALKNVVGVNLLEFDESQKSGFKNIVAELVDQWPLPRDLTIEILNAENILARAHYAPPLHVKSAHIPHMAEDLPLTEGLAERFLNLPCGQRVSKEDIERIAVLLKFIAEHSHQILDRLERTT